MRKITGIILSAAIALSMMPYTAFAETVETEPLHEELPQSELQVQEESPDAEQDEAKDEIVEEPPAADTQDEIKNGWTDEDGAVRYYENDVYAKGIKEIDGSLYFFGEDGALVKDRMFVYEGGKYYANQDGTLKTKEFLTVKSSNDAAKAGEMYYFGDDGKAAVYTFYVDGIRYYASGDGVITKNKIIEFKKYGYKIYFGKDGKAVKGFFTGPDGKRYHANDDFTISRYTFYVGSDRYYASGDGVLTVNKRVDFKSNGYSIYFGKDGKAVKGFFYAGNKRYYADSNGFIKKYTFYVNGKRYYGGSDGALAINKFVTFHKTGETRFFGSDGAMKCYTFYNGGKRYYASGDGVVQKNRVIYFKKYGYSLYFGPDGSAQRRYQNPKGMLQFTSSPSKHGQSFYMSPCKVNDLSTRSQHVEAMIDRAYDYLGDPYVVCRSGKPGAGVDCSGLVMQAGYAAGVDFYPSTPYRHTFPAYEYESREIWKLRTLKTVSWANRQRGDLIFYANRNGIVTHIAIYLGNNKIIHSWPGGVRVSNVYGWGNHIKGVKRVFN